MRSAGILWIIGGLTSALVAFFVGDLADQVLFTAGAVLGTAMGIVLILRPTPTAVSLSNLLGLAWAIAYGLKVIVSLSLPVEQLLSVVWVLGFGVAGAVVARRRQRHALDDR
jgi:hypothetical protein